jgi:NADP-dependent 3-hydroxy acid dehydrogenase YdfG
MSAANGIQGRVAVVTGASSGIGQAIARALSAEGSRVALLSRRQETLDALAQELSGAGAEAIAMAGDVTDRGSMQRAAARVASELGSASILVNAAGEALLAPFGSDQTEETRRLVEVNLLGAMTVTEVFLEQLRDSGGDIVNMSSVGGRNARKGASVYNATKWGLNGWSEGLRQELLPDIRVLVVEPGAVDTPIIDKVTHEASKRAFRETYPPGTMLEPADVAEAVVFALSRPRRVAVNEILLRPSTQLY